MHRIGCNAALLCMLTCVYSVQLTEGIINCTTAAIRTMTILGRPSIEMVAPTDPTDSIPPDNQQISGTTRVCDWTLPTDAELEKEYLDYGEEQGDMNVIPPLIPREDLSEDDDLLSHQISESLYNQVSATVGAGAGTDTTLGASNDTYQVNIDLIT